MTDKKKEIIVEEVTGADRPTADVFGLEELAKNVVETKQDLVSAKECYDEAATKIKEKAQEVRNEYEADSGELFENVRFPDDNSQRVDIQFISKRKKLTKKLKAALEAGLTDNMRNQIVVEEHRLVVTGPAIDDVLEYLEDVGVDEEHFKEEKELLPVENASAKLKTLEEKVNSNGEVSRERRVALNLFRDHIAPELTVNVRSK